MRSLIITALLTGAALVSSCGCPIGTKPLYVETGTYKIFGYDGTPKVQFPSREATGKTLVIDRQTETIRVSYSLNGKQYVETWRVSNVHGP